MADYTHTIDRWDEATGKPGAAKLKAPELAPLESRRSRMSCLGRPGSRQASLSTLSGFRLGLRQASSWVACKGVGLRRFVGPDRIRSAFLASSSEEFYKGFQ
jgi:hypothetical protein